MLILLNTEYIHVKTIIKILLNPFSYCSNLLIIHCIMPVPERKKKNHIMTQLYAFDEWLALTGKLNT